MADRARDGFVSLVGAGPGDPGLLTRKGAQRLSEADTIVHDQLVAPPLLDLASPDARVLHRREIGDGKQAAINDFLVQEASRGRRVVRLKGGDPFVFGRGAEEARVLADAGIAFEIVPGVSSGIGVPAYAGIPVTHRKHVSSVTFVTGHEDPEKAQSAVEWERLVRTGGTLVVFMGVRRMSEVIKALLSAGADPATPVAAIEWGTTPRQRTVEATLEDIVGQVTRQKLDHPALIVIGHTVRERTGLDWFESRPLWGRRVLVTRAQEQAPSLIEALREVGAGVIGMPVLEFAPPSDPSLLPAAVARLVDAAWDDLLLTSTNAVRALFGALDEAELDVRALGGLRIAAIGPGTANALADRFVRADLVAEASHAEGLLEALTAAGPLAGRRMLLPRAETARELLPETLRAAGVALDVVPAYRTVAPERTRESARHHLELADTVTFTSPSSVKNLIAMVGDDALSLLRERSIAAIGPITARALERRQLRVDVLARTPTVDGLVAELVAAHAAAGEVVREGSEPGSR